MVRMMKVVKVKPQAERVPLGMDLAGATSSPDKLAPAMIPEQSPDIPASAKENQELGKFIAICPLANRLFRKPIVINVPYQYVRGGTYDYFRTNIPVPY
jgi:hypothetical protein